MRRMMIGALLVGVGLVGCKRPASTEGPSADAWGSGAPPPGRMPATTRDSGRSDARPSGGRAEPVARPGGPVIIDGTGGGSPGTR